MKHKNFFLEWEQRLFQLPEQLADFLAIHPSDGALEHAQSFLRDWFSSKAHFEQKTSGSTGIPQTIFLERDKMLRSAQRSCTFFQLHAKSKLLLALDLGYIAGKMQLVRAMVCGGTALLRPSTDPFGGWNGRVDFATLVPAQLLKHWADIHRVETLLLGGSAVPSALRESIAQLKKPKIYLGYGMTETYSHIACKRLNGSEGDECYSALEGVELAIDSRGALCIKDRLLGLELTTNDRVELLNDHAFHWLGRIDFVINSGGKKVQAEQVEAVAGRRCDRRLLCIGRPHPKWGEEVVLLIEGEEDTALLTAIAQDMLVLEKHERPKSYAFIPAFSATWNGKIDRQGTKEEYLSGLRD